MARENALGDLWRRRVGGILLSMGLLAASIGYSGLILRGIITDDGVATRAAGAALDDERVQRLLADETATAIGQQLLGPETLASLEAFGIDPSADLHAIAQAVMADPRFDAAFVETVRQLHHIVLVESGPAPVIDVTPLVTVARDAAVARNSAYAALFPPDGTLRVAVPSDELPDLTGPSTTLGDKARLVTLAAVVLVTAGMLVHSRRPRGLRRIGFWSVGTASVQALLALALPLLAARVPGDIRGVAEAVAETLRPQLLVPAAMLAAVGAALVAAAWRWQRADDGADGRLGARAFLGADPLVPQAMFDGEIELATHMSPVNAHSVPLATSPRDEYSPLPGSSVFGDIITSRSDSVTPRSVSPRAGALPTTRQGG